MNKIVNYTNEDPKGEKVYAIELRRCKDAGSPYINYIAMH